MRGAEEVWDIGSGNGSGTGTGTGRRGRSSGIAGKGGLGVRSAFRHAVADRLHSAAIHLLRWVRNVAEQSGIRPAWLPPSFAHSLLFSPAKPCDFSYSHFHWLINPPHHPQSFYRSQPHTTRKYLPNTDTHTLKAIFSNPDTHHRTTASPL